MNKMVNEIWKPAWRYLCHTMLWEMFTMGSAIDNFDVDVDIE